MRTHWSRSGWPSRASEQKAGPGLGALGAPFPSKISGSGGCWGVSRSEPCEQSTEVPSTRRIGAAKGAPSRGGVGAEGASPRPATLGDAWPGSHGRLLRFLPGF